VPRTAPSHSVVAALRAGTIVAGCGSKSTSTAKVASDCATSAPTTPTVRTKDDVFVASVESYQAMYTPAQVRATHPTTGEVMVAGDIGMRSAMPKAPKSAMTGKHPPTMGSTKGMKGTAMGGSQHMAMGGRLRHLEVRVCSRRTGHVIMVHPTISFQDQSSPHAMSRSAPADAMEGIGQGRRDLHYGGNVMMVAGHRYAVSVRVDGERAVVRMLLRSGKPPVALP
jgi:hypothetical protein